MKEEYVYPRFEKYIAKNFLALLRNMWLTGLPSHFGVDPDFSRFKF